MTFFVLNQNTLIELSLSLNPFIQFPLNSIKISGLKAPFTDTATTWLIPALGNSQSFMMWSSNYSWDSWSFFFFFFSSRNLSFTDFQNTTFSWPVGFSLFLLFLTPQPELSQISVLRALFSDTLLVSCLKYLLYSEKFIYRLDHSTVEHIRRTMCLPCIATACQTPQCKHTPKQYQCLLHLQSSFQFI